MINGKKVVIVMPAYNTARTIAKALGAIPKDVADQIIVVDDGSKDTTGNIARSLGATVFRHDPNRGYGAAQKTGYRKALEAGGDIMVMVHADFQYDPTLVPEIVRPLAEGKADACFGSRMAQKGGARKGGMPWWRFIANCALTFAEDIVFGLGLSEYHTGYRAYSRQALEAIPFERNSDNYVFDTEMYAELSLGRFRVAEIPIPTRYLADSQSPNFRQSVVYGLSTLRVMAQYLLHRSGLKRYPQYYISANR